MPPRDNSMGRRDFVTKGARAAAAATAGLLGASVAQEAMPDDKTITFGEALPTRTLGKTKVELPMLGYGGAALQKQYGKQLCPPKTVSSWFVTPTIAAFAISIPRSATPTATARQLSAKV
jgi:hypothetical protein